MSILLSGLSSTHYDFTDAQNQAIDDVSIALSEGNWTEHLQELYLSRPTSLDINAQDLEKAADDFILYHEGKNLDDHTRWHVELAKQVKTLALITQQNGGDTVGIAG